MWRYPGIRYTGIPVLEALILHILDLSLSIDYYNGSPCLPTWFLFTVRLCEAYTHGIAVGILSVRPSVFLTRTAIVVVNGKTKV